MRVVSAESSYVFRPALLHDAACQLQIRGDGVPNRRGSTLHVRRRLEAQRPEERDMMKLHWRLREGESDDVA